jgi:hypothetical protein
MRRIGWSILVLAVIGIGIYVGLQFLPTGSGIKVGLDLALQRLPPGWSASYQSVDYDQNADRIALKGFSFHNTDPSKPSGTIDEIDIAGLPADLGTAWLAAARPDQSRPDQAVPLAGSVMLKNLALALDHQRLKLGSATLDRPVIYPWALLHSGIPSYRDVAALLDRPSDEQLPADLVPVLRYIACYALGIGADSLQAADLGVAGSAPDQAMVAIAALDVAHLDRGILGTAGVTGLGAKQAGQADVAIDRLALTALDLRGLLTGALSDANFDPLHVSGATLGRIEADGIRAGTPSGAPATLARIDLDDLSIVHGLVASGNVAIDGVKLAKAQLPDENALRAAFDRLGLDSVTVSFGAGYRLDQTKKTASLSGVRVKIDELAELTLSADFGDLDAADSAEQNATLVHAQLHYVDASLAGRALKAGADDNELAPGQFALQIAGFVQVQAAQLLGDSPEVAAAVQAVTNFLTDPHSLTIELAPPKPVELASLQTEKPNPAEIFAELGVKVTANQ